MNPTLDKKLRPELIIRLVGVCFFAYLFFGFMLLPCLNTLTSIFNTKTPPGSGTPSLSSASSSPAPWANSSGTR